MIILLRYNMQRLKQQNTQSIYPKGAVFSKIALTLYMTTEWNSRERLYILCLP